MAAPKGSPHETRLLKGHMFVCAALAERASERRHATQALLALHALLRDLPFEHQEPSSGTVAGYSRRYGALWVRPSMLIGTAAGRIWTNFAGIAKLLRDDGSLVARLRRLPTTTVFKAWQANGTFALDSSRPTLRGQYLALAGQHAPVRLPFRGAVLVGHDPEREEGVFLLALREPAELATLPAPLRREWITHPGVHLRRAVPDGSAARGTTRAPLSHELSPRDLEELQASALTAWPKDVANHGTRSWHTINTFTSDADRVVLVHDTDMTAATAAVGGALASLPEDTSLDILIVDRHGLDALFVAAPWLPIVLGTLPDAARATALLRLAHALRRERRSKLARTALCRAIDWYPRSDDVLLLQTILRALLGLHEWYRAGADEMTELRGCAQRLWTRGAKSAARDVVRAMVWEGGVPPADWLQLAQDWDDHTECVLCGQNAWLRASRERYEDEGGQDVAVVCESCTRYVIAPGARRLIASDSELRERVRLAITRLCEGLPVGRALWPRITVGVEPERHLIVGLPGCDLLVYPDGARRRFGHRRAPTWRESWKHERPMWKHRELVARYGLPDKTLPDEWPLVDNDAGRKALKAWEEWLRQHPEYT